MAGWSILANGSTVDCGKTNGSFQSGSGCSLDGSGGCRDKLKYLFDQVLSIVSKEVDCRSWIRTIPAMLGDGQSLDLFKLFCVVRERGGFHMVSKNGLWDFVLRELGLDLGVSASVKLIYSKYLGELEKWLMGNRGLSLGNGSCDYSWNFSLLPLELETEFRGLLMNWPNKKIKDDRLDLLELKKKGKHAHVDTEKSKSDLWDTRNRHERCNSFAKGCRDDDDKFHDNEDKLCDNDPGVTQNEFVYHKRKRESLSGMLNWVIQIAKCTDYPSIAVIPEPSKWKEHGDKELWMQAIRTREVLRQRRRVDNIQQSLLRNTPKMHPSMYEDIPQPTERLRCSARHFAIVKSHLCSCCGSCSAFENKLTRPCRTNLVTGLKVEAPASVTSPTMNATVCCSGDDPREKLVLVGSQFQANVPEWNDLVLESDCRWLGTRIWPWVDEEQNSLIEIDPVGRGRPDSCCCRLPGSVECVRFHIAEKRLKLKLELGSVFYHWRFDRMGEEVSLRWTEEEEKRFRDMVKFNRSLSADFWGIASECFLRKKREDSVSYYFNVFLVRRRSYQNRVTPRDIDSDDDESEFGSVSNSFGHEAVKVHGSNSLTCTQNNQCTDLD